MSRSVCRNSNINFERTVRMLCPIIKERIDLAPRQSESESWLRKQLIACLLGSQIKQEAAEATLDRLEESGLLDDEWWMSSRPFYDSHLFACLSGYQDGIRTHASHRFPRARTLQIAGARDALLRSPLLDRLESSHGAQKTRQALVKDIPGLGPKQASMFLRNVGFTYDLAIVDTHVARFFTLQEPNVPMRLGTIRLYERAECVVKQYASFIGYPVGYVDWAIWLTMRAARELQS